MVKEKGEPRRLLWHEEVPGTLEVVNLLEPHSVRRLANHMEQNGGRAAILVHPFTELESLEYNDMRLTLPRKDEDDYFRRLRSLVSGIMNNGGKGKELLPLVVMAEVGPTFGSLPLSTYVEGTAKRLRRYFFDYLSLNQGELFMVLTENLLGMTPYKIDANDLARLFGLPEVERLSELKIEEAESRAAITLVQGLRNIGLKRALVGGVSLGWGKERSHSIFRRAFKQEWTLANHYRELDKGQQGLNRRQRNPHIFETVFPRHCVGTAIQLLAFAGIQVGVSTATYPRRMRRRSEMRAELARLGVL